MNATWDEKLPAGLRFMLTKTTKGRIGLIIGQHKFRKAGAQKDGSLVFRCSVKDCPARVNLDAAMRRILRIRSIHNHPGRDLSDIISTRLPSGLISSDGNLEQDLKIGRKSQGSKSALKLKEKKFSEETLKCRQTQFKLLRGFGKDLHTILWGMASTFV